MRIHFDGEPRRFQQMRALFNTTSTLRQKPEWRRPISAKFRLRLQSVDQWFRKWGRAA